MFLSAFSIECQVCLEKVRNSSLVAVEARCTAVQFVSTLNTRYLSENI